MALSALLVLVVVAVVLGVATVPRLTSLVASPEAARTPAPPPPAATAPPATPSPGAPGSIASAYNSTGISDDGTADVDLDGFGYSYSEHALTVAGLGPGAAVTSGGVRYVMPDVPAGRPDNVQPTGRPILAPSLPGATLLGFLGASVDGDASGTVTIAYTDGSTQTAAFTFSDWTLGGGGSSPDAGNVAVAASAYRNAGSDVDTTTTYVFATAPIQLQAGKTLQSVQLTPDAGEGTMHVFSIGTDQGAVT